MAEWSFMVYNRRLINITMEKYNFDKELNFIIDISV